MGRRVPGDTRMSEARHGVDCSKALHTKNGYLHAPDDDSPYDVDGVIYCGRCHAWIELPVPEGDNHEAVNRAVVGED